MDCIDQKVMGGIRNHKKPTKKAKQRIKEVAQEIQERERKRMQRKYLLELQKSRGGYNG